MATRKPLVLVAGRPEELAAGDTLSRVREQLTADRSYYVRTDGNDSNTGLTNTSGGAFLTIQKALDTVASLDMGIYNIVIYIGVGTWTASNTLKSLVGAGTVTIRGINNNSTDTIIAPTAGAGFIGTIQGKYTFIYLRMSANTTNGVCIDVSGGGAFITWYNIYFYAAAVHVRISNAAAGSAGGNYSIYGGATIHAAAYDGGTIRVQNVTVTIVGTPAFIFTFSSERAAVMLITGTTFSGAATGARYQVTLNAVLFVNGAGATYLPGNAAGGAASGGQYV